MQGAKSINNRLRLVGATAAALVAVTGSAVAGGFDHSRAVDRVPWLCDGRRGRWRQPRFDVLELCGCGVSFRD